MAKVHEEILVIKMSKLVKDNQEVSSLVSEDTLSALEQVVQELVGEGVLIEVEKA